MKRSLPWVLILVLLLALPRFAVAGDGAFLTGEDLHALEPAYEQFLEVFADTLVKRGLLQEAEREAWILYQIGDFMQNGGFGSIAVMYTPGLLSVADPGTTARRLSVETGAGTIALSTLRRYVPELSPLPGLPLDIDLTDPGGSPVPCRFRYTASDGSFCYWDGTTGQMTDVGATVVGDGRTLYWSDAPAEGLETVLTFEMLRPDEDTSLATASLLLRAGPDYWAPEEMK